MNSTDQDLYEIAGNELFSKSPNMGLWTMAFANAKGDETLAKALYIDLRVADLRENLARQASAEKQRYKEEARANEQRLKEETRNERQRLKEEARANEQRLKAEALAKAASTKEADERKKVEAAKQQKEASLKSKEASATPSRFKAKLKEGNNWSYERFHLYILHEGLHFIPLNNQLPEAFVSPKLGDKIKMRIPYLYIDENVHITLSDGKVLKVLLGWGPYLALRAWLGKQ
jgi:hypothetical protein